MSPASFGNTHHCIKKYSVFPFVLVQTLSSVLMNTLSRSTQLTASTNPWKPHTSAHFRKWTAHKQSLFWTCCESQLPFFMQITALKLQQFSSVPYSCRLEGHLILAPLKSLWMDMKTGMRLDAWFTNILYKACPENSFILKELVWTSSLVFDCQAWSQTPGLTQLF